MASFAERDRQRGRFAEETRAAAAAVWWSNLSVSDIGRWRSQQLRLSLLTSEAVLPLFVFSFLPLQTAIGQSASGNRFSSFYALIHCHLSIFCMTSCLVTHSLTRSLTRTHSQMCVRYLWSVSAEAQKHTIAEWRREESDTGDCLREKLPDTVFTVT